MLQAIYDVGVYGTDSYEEVSYPTVLTTVREKPPLRVTMDIETPVGKHYRWAEDEPAPENVPSGLRWSDTMPGGFESLDCTLPRKPGIDYSDLEQLSTIRVLGASGDVAGEYRLERSPRTSGDEVAISPGAVGWQAHLEDDKSAREIFVDRDLTRWESMPASRVIANEAAGNPTNQGSVGVEPETVSGTPQVVLEFSQVTAVTGTKIPNLEAWYRSDGIPVYYLDGTYNEREGTSASFTSANWNVIAHLSDPTLVTADSSANLAASADPAFFSVLATGVEKVFAWIQMYYPITVGPVDGSWRAEFSNLAVVGYHLLTGRGAFPNGGYYASDVVAHAVPRWAPMLNVTAESVQTSSFVISHLVFHDPTTVGEMVRQVTRFGLQDWAVWENKTFWWHERGAHAKLWRSRVAPAQLDETGPQVDRLWESIIVQYQDVDGTTKTVGPPGSGANTESASLKDSDPENPANQLGIIRRDILQMGTSTSAGAIEVGRRFLEESQLLDRSGRARIVGHVEDSSGVLHPYWRPRAGDYISFIDAADTSYRRIVKTDKSHSERTCGLDLDAPPEGLKALLERLGVVLVPLGLS